MRGLLHLRGFLLSWATIVVAVLAWRHIYYGAWVPNTVLAKAHPLNSSQLSLGFIYLIRFAGRSAPWLAISIFVLLLDAPIGALIGVAWLAFQIVVVLINAGDWMPGYRLLSVYLPVIAILSAFAVERLFTRRIYRTWSLAALCVICCLVQVRDRRWTYDKGILNRHSLVEMLDDDANSFRQIAAALRPVLTPGDIIAPEMLGLFSYMLLDIPMHDWLGLADAHVAQHGTVFYPRLGKAEPVYSVETVAPTAFILMRPYNPLSTLREFQRDTAGRFAKRYGWWEVINRPATIILAIRRDREQDIVAAVRRSTLQIRPFVFGQAASN